jgi:hypothetical protein
MGAKLQQRLGEQIDIILTAAEPDEQQPIEQIAKETCMLMTITNYFFSLKKSKSSSLFSTSNARTI